MVYNDFLPTSPATLYTVPVATPGVPNSGAPETINLFRVVNESGVARTFTIWLSTHGAPHAVTPVDTQLPIGAAYDDLPTFQLPPGGLIIGVASGVGVSWTVNAEPHLPVLLDSNRLQRRQ